MFIGKSTTSSFSSSLPKEGNKSNTRLAVDLKIEFPNMKGFSLRNLRYMRAFAQAYPSFVRQGAAKFSLDIPYLSININSLYYKFKFKRKEVSLIYY
ncbi:MAG TPA: hypothetical protein DCQ50_10110 [Chryseobacterium sp.]|nr:hypothetical protein [Chryseobacterium sp.]